GPSVTLNKISSASGMIIESMSELGRIDQSTISWSGNDYIREDREASGRHTSTIQNATDKRMNVYTTYGQQYSIEKVLNSRFIFASSLLGSFAITDGGRSSYGNYSESASLSDPDDPFSFTNLTVSKTINGKTSQNVYNMSAKTFTETSPLGRVRTTILNTLGDTQSIQVGALTPVTISYNTQGKISSLSRGTGRETNFSYNTLGYLEEVENSLGEKTNYTYDLAGRVLTTTLNDSRVIQFGYDSSGNLVSVTPPGKSAHLMSYNEINEMTSYTPPALIPTATTFSYSDDRELLSISKASGDTISFSYDPTLGNLTSISFSGGTRSFSYSYGVLNSSTSEDYISRYPTQTGTKITGDYLQVDGNLVYILATSYNPDHLKSQDSLSLGITSWSIPYTYDNDGFLISAGDLTVARELSLGLVEETSLEGVTEEYSYSTNYGELSSLEAKYLTAALYKEEVTRDALGRIISMTEKYGSSPVVIRDFTYDSTGRLTEVEKKSLPHSSYIYDSNSNRTSETVNSVTTTATYDGEDQLLTFGTKSFTYNLNGEVTA